MFELKEEGGMVLLCISKFFHSILKCKNLNSKGTKMTPLQGSSFLSIDQWLQLLHNITFMDIHLVSVAIVV